MSDITNNYQAATPVMGTKALQLSAQFWFVVMLIGQWFFVAYLLILYGGSAARGDLDVWGTKLSHGYVPGDFIGNLAVASHLLLAVIIMVAGPLQLVPQIRARAPKFHRWSGRTYLVAVLLTSIAGLYMLWVHGTVGGLILALGQSLDALLIIIFAGFALRAALARNFAAHRRWALRLFMVVSAVWFFRVGLMLWLVIHQAPVGFNPDTFEGPFVNFIVIAQYAIPLAVLELYFRAQDHKDAWVKVAAAIFIALLTLAMALGIFGAVMGLWLPHL